MALIYKIDVLEALKEKGFTTYILRKDKLLSESTIQSLRNSSPISWDNLDRICSLLNCQPADIIEHVDF